MNTREKILDKALKMFNEWGIEYVGLRELAAHLEIRVSNITYYFPTKDDLVFDLSQQLSQKNAAVMVTDEKITMSRFLEMMQRVFQHHVQYRCLLLSFVHVMKQNRMVAASYKKTQGTRSTTIRSNLEAMFRSGYLAIRDDEEKEFLVSMVSLISRFWISEAAISFRKGTAEEQANHYLQLMANAMLPYASAKGKREIQKFVISLFNEKET